MIITIHQPEHLPWLGYFHKMALVDYYVYLDNVQYRHHYVQNRQHVMGPQDAVWVTVPILKQQTRYGIIYEQVIDNSRKWRTSYWHSIESQYHQHPYYDQYAETLHDIIMTPYDLLVDLNLALIDFFRQALDIKVPTIRASTLEVEGAKGELIHNICQALDASVYLSGPSGRDYLDETTFSASGINLWYHDFPHPTYPQYGKQEFCNNLSVWDLLCNCGPHSREVLLSNSIAVERERLRLQKGMINLNQPEALGDRG